MITLRHIGRLARRAAWRRRLITFWDEIRLNQGIRLALEVAVCSEVASIGCIDIGLG